MSRTHQDPDPDPRLDDFGLEKPVVTRERETGGQGPDLLVYPVLHEQQVLEALHDLPEWTYRDGRLRRRFELDLAADLTRFCEWLRGVAAELACKPEVRTRGLEVEVVLTTHAAGDRVTACDVELATAIEEWLAAPLG